MCITIFSNSIPDPKECCSGNKLSQREMVE
uniref:Uncharacterized protein n=1 Tax=Anguilla anguilla TaxID=7936 RepID=A0A0E9Q3K0_ANGAN